MHSSENHEESSEPDSLAAIIRRQGHSKPITIKDLIALAPDDGGFTDEEHKEFLAWLYAERRANLA